MDPIPHMAGKSRASILSLTGHPQKCKPKGSNDFKNINPPKQNEYSDSKTIFEIFKNQNQN